MGTEIWMAGGGTGGHLIPGLALADAFRALDPDCTVRFRHADRPVDRALLAERPHSHPAGVGPLRMRPRVLWRYGRAFFAARRELKAAAPALVVGLGGYASFPHVRAAQTLGLPTVLFEANAIAGRATRHLARRAAKILCPWPAEALRGVTLRPGQACSWGLPIRPPAALSPEDARSRLGFAPDARLLLVTGGSQGAAALNAFLAGAAPYFAANGVALLHLAGEKDAPGLRETYRNAAVTARVESFLDDMPAAYRAARAVLCRAGGATLAELAAHRLPAVAVPYPHAADDHQRANAETAERYGGARCVAQDALGPDTLAALLRWLTDPSAHAAQAARWEPLARERAAEDCARGLAAAWTRAAPDRRPIACTATQL